MSMLMPSWLICPSQKVQPYTRHLVMVVDVCLIVVKTCTSSDSRLYHQAD